MKTQITKILAAALMITATFGAQATTNNTERNLKVSAKSQKSVVLQLANLNSDAEITLTDQDGKLLYHSYVDSDQYAKTFDLNAVEEGEVYLQIETEDRLEILPIEITANKAQIKRSAEMVIEKAIVKTKGDMAKVFFGDNDSEIKVTLFDASDDIAFRDKVEEGTSHRTYDMSKLSDGTYKMQIRSNGRSFYHTIILK